MGTKTSRLYRHWLLEQYCPPQALLALGWLEQTLHTDRQQAELRECKCPIHDLCQDSIRDILHQC